MKVKDLIKKLQEDYKPEDEIISDFWTFQDIMDCAENNDVTLSREQANKVMQRVENKFDATIGINWDIIEFHIDEIIKEEK